MAHTEAVRGDSGLGALAEDLASTSLHLARRFAAGATMWCVSPAWPAHARHVAVEFVHPVIVGKRALPAVALEGPRVLDDLRALARSGDILVAVAAVPDDGALTAGLLRRATAWGLTTVWIGAGARPSAGAADHVLFVADSRDDPLVDAEERSRAVFGGRVVLLYHLLWELTHVCFEHPGLLEPTECEGPVCVTCSDEGRLAEVIGVGAEHVLHVRSARGREAVDAGLVECPRPGDLVLVHGGCAVALVEGDPA